MPPPIASAIDSLLPGVADLTLPGLFALAFLVALAGGAVARFLGMPRVIGYILGGVVLGEWGFNVFPAIHDPKDDPFSIINDLALALVMLQLGSAFYMPAFRTIRKHILTMMAAETLLTAALVMAAIGAVAAFAGTVSWHIPVLLGILAMETAPATALVVLREQQAEGPVSQSIMLMIALNNLAVLVVFDFVFFGVMGHGAGSDIGTRFLMNIGGGMVIGFVGAFLLATAYERLGGKDRAAAFLLLLFGIVFLGVQLHIQPLLIFLFLGVVLANIGAEIKDSIITEYNGLAYPLYILFFVIAGARMHINELLSLDVLGVVLLGAYLAARTTGKITGATLGAYGTGAEDVVRKYTGIALLPQAGLAIGLSYVVLRENPALGTELQHILMPCIIGFEIAGAITVKSAVYRAGETKVTARLDNINVTAPLDSVWAMFSRLLIAFGMRQSPPKRNAKDLTAADLMRPQIPTIKASANLEDVIEFIENFHLATAPVVDEKGGFLGVVSYEEIREILFQPDLAEYVIAYDLMRPGDFSVTPDTPARAVLEEMREHALDAVPVVITNEAGRREFVGLVEQRSLLSVIGRDNV